MELKTIKITEKRQKQLNQIGIHCVEDLLMILPQKYQIIEETLPTIDNPKIIVEGTLVSDPRVYFKGRLSRMTFSFECSLGIYNVTIFNRHFLRQHLHIGKTVCLFGKLDSHGIVASDIKMNNLNDIKGITPVYQTQGELTQKTIVGLIHKAYQAIDELNIIDLPEDVKSEYELCSMKEALRCIHFPKNSQDTIIGMKTLKYDELLRFHLSMRILKDQKQKEFGIKKEFDRLKIQEFILSLPYELTEDQRNSSLDIMNDLESDQAMHRFLQGDVGSGKTMVAAIGLYANTLAGYQGALMSPTEILATQHFHTLKKLFKDQLRIELLVGSLTTKEKMAIYERLAHHEIDIIVGTHALFQDKVMYDKLGLVVTDEQHRFGVKQRQALKEKGQFVDFLVMSATPIPRTLALSMYGDMDVSTIMTMPKGRQVVESSYITGSSMKPFLPQLESYLDEGGQCFVVCPLVEESENVNAKNASFIAGAMQRYFKERHRVGLLHGQMKDDEKDAVMNEFIENNIQILVSTTVIEVGVDVPNANMMIIYNSERFGLSQLHQLRGRVGRGHQKAYCYFLSESPDAKDKLSFIASCHNGFDISLYDLKMRGPGEFFGAKQSGVPIFQIADLFEDYDILQKTKEDATRLYEMYENYHYNEKYVNNICDKLKVNNEYVD